MTSLSCP